MEQWRVAFCSFLFQVTRLHAAPALHVRAKELAADRPPCTFRLCEPQLSDDTQPTSITKTNPPPYGQDEAKMPTTFLSLPAELRNYIYDLSGCLKILQCLNCHYTARGDDKYAMQFHERIGRAMPQWREKASLWVSHSTTLKTPGGGFGS